MTGLVAERATLELMITDYLPILLQVIVAIGFAASALIVSVLLGKTGRRNPTKDSAYECGMVPEGGAQPRFSVKFYLVAMLFILFDIEVVFLYPIAVQLEAFGVFALIETGVFIALLMIAFVFVWRRGALDWR